MAGIRDVNRRGPRIVSLRQYIRNRNNDMPVDNQGQNPVIDPIMNQGARGVSPPHIADEQEQLPGGVVHMADEQEQIPGLDVNIADQQKPLPGVDEHTANFLLLAEHGHFDPPQLPIDYSQLQEGEAFRLYDSQPANEHLSWVITADEKCLMQRTSTYVPGVHCWICHTQLSAVIIKNYELPCTHIVHFACLPEIRQVGYCRFCEQGGAYQICDL